MFKQVQIYLLSFFCVYCDHCCVVWLVATLEWNASGDSESRYGVAGGLTPLVGVLNYRTAHSVRKGLNFIWGCVTLAMQFPDTSKKNFEPA